MPVRSPHSPTPRRARTIITQLAPDVPVHTSPHSPNPQTCPYAHHTHPSPRCGRTHITALTQPPDVLIHRPSKVPAHQPNPQICPHTQQLRVGSAHSPNLRRPAHTTPQPPTHTHISPPRLLRAQPLLSSENSSSSLVPSPSRLATGVDNKSLKTCVPDWGSLRTRPWPVG